MIGAVISKRLV